MQQQKDQVSKDNEMGLDFCQNLSQHVETKFQNIIKPQDTVITDINLILMIVGKSGRQSNHIFKDLFLHMCAVGKFQKLSIRR